MRHYVAQKIAQIVTAHDDIIDDGQRFRWIVFPQCLS
jgi:hypothetical protein